MRRCRRVPRGVAVCSLIAAAILVSAGGVHASDPRGRETTRHVAASDSVWVTVAREAVLGSGGNADEVRRDALFGALGDAVAQVAGVDVQGSTMAVRGERGGRVEESFVRALHVEGRGTAIAWTVLDERWEVRRGGRGAGVPTFRIRVRVLVLRERERPDPQFHAAVRLSSPVCVVRGASLADGDELQVFVSASDDAHWVVVSLIGDSVDVLAPNAVETVVASRAGAWRGVPSDSLRAIGVRFRCALPATRRTDRETIVAVATRYPVAPPVGTARGMSPETARIGLADFNQWLAGIPPRARALAESALEVRTQR